MAIKLSQWQQKQLMHDWKQNGNRPAHPPLAPTSHGLQSPQNKHVKHFSISLLQNDPDAGDLGSVEIAPEDENTESPINRVNEVNAVA
jgi:hypothetical protein